MPFLEISNSEIERSKELIMRIFKNLLRSSSKVNDGTERFDTAAVIFFDLTCLLLSSLILERFDFLTGVVKSYH